MTLATCNRHCPRFHPGPCELSGFLEPGLPVLCPYYQHRENAVNPAGEVISRLSGLPPGSATSSHSRCPALGPALPQPPRSPEK